MEATMDGTLAKWGNSQGMRISKEMCDVLGVRLGTPYHAVADPATSTVTITFAQPQSRYHRNRKVSMEELCAGWEGNKVGEEWGGPDVGAEVVE